MEAGELESLFVTRMATIAENIERQFVPKLMANSWGCVRTIIEVAGVGIIIFVSIILLVNDFDKLKEKVVNPLTGKKIGAYYGCLLLRPGKIMAFDDPENPTIMEDFIRALGAEPVIYPYRNECCGGYISLKEKEMSQNMCQKIEDSAKGFGADMLITACPLCKSN